MLNGILYNLETLFNVKQKHIDTLEKCDKYFWQALFCTPKSAPIEGYFIECSAMPIRFILMGKRIMFLWALLNKSEEELVKRVFSVQIEMSSENSWIENVKSDLLRLKIELSFDEIASLSKSQFKDIAQPRTHTPIQSTWFGKHYYC